MIKANCLTLLILLIGTQLSWGHKHNRAKADSLYESRTVEAIRVKRNVKIDGKLNEACWRNAPVAKRFYTFKPTMGLPARQASEVQMVYDDQAIYIAARLYDTSPDSIFTSLTRRDERVVNSDRFWVTINPYNDGKNIFRFEVTAANVQTDIRISDKRSDKAWNAVWESEVEISDQGWNVEIRIPYDAIRFPGVAHQIWGINYWRQVSRSREVSSWNFVDRTLEDQGSQTGRISGIDNIEAPFRLALFPYTSAYLNADDKNTSYSYSAGMDLKYGINESFTLDMILIPDFGQRKSDNEVLNLSPFEVKYNENRPFFTEGIDLFNKAGLFYSRRIGAQPSGYYDVDDQLHDGESVDDNPAESKLVNATKISGRNKKGLGLGFFQALTSNTYAKINKSSGGSRRYLTEPLTNYNMLVVDKNYGEYSYVNLINTNYYQPDTRKMANVLGAAFKISDVQNLYAIQGVASYSSVYEDLSETGTDGQRLNLTAGKVSGQIQYNYQLRLLTEEYTHNYMGYLRRNNLLSNQVSLRYGVYEPRGILLNWATRLNAEYASLWHPRRFNSLYMRWNGSATFSNYTSFGFWSEFSPMQRRDYYEARQDDFSVFNRPASYWYKFWFSTDYRKVLAFDGQIGSSGAYADGFFFRIGPRVQVNDKFNFSYTFDFDERIGERGYVDELEMPKDTLVILGRRDKQTITNSFAGAYVFSNKASLTLNMRHYWSVVDYDAFYHLQNDGGLQKEPGYSENVDFNFNVFNFDLVFSWNFAPGSFFNVVWKNSILQEGDIFHDQFYSFGENIQETFRKENMNNSLSVKISYYLDYKQLFKRNNRQASS